VRNAPAEAFGTPAEALPALIQFDRALVDAFADRYAAELDEPSADDPSMPADAVTGHWNGESLDVGYAVTILASATATSA
jgi:hypothetical protein